MGKLDLSRFSETTSGYDTQKKEITATAPTMPLEQAYSNLWGGLNEKVENINLIHLNNYMDAKGHPQPFKINEEKIAQIMASAEDIGIITPLIVRKTEGIRYQIIAGHHRYEAAKRLNLLTVPCIIRNISDEDIFQIVAESNIQRSKTLPSEYGRIFKVYMDKRSDIDMTAQEIANKFGISKKNMYRYISVTKLIPDLQEYADNGIIQLAAVEIISDFSDTNQKTIQEILERPDKKKITPAIAKNFAEAVSEYNGDDVPIQNFTCFLYSMPRNERKYKSNVYNNLTARFKIDKSEEELDAIVEKLLADYFTKETL